MKAIVQKPLAFINRYAAPLALLGVAGAAVFHCSRWRHDRRLAAQMRNDQNQPVVLRQTPKVSVLVAAWNEQAHIDAHLHSFLTLGYPDCELILCAGGTDDTLERARCYAGPRVIILEQHAGEGKQRALARCLQHASGEIIYLTDADCIYNSQALRRLLAVLIDGGEVAATGRFAPFAVDRTHPFVSNQWAVDNYARAHSGAYVGGLIGRNAALTRVALEQSHALEVAVPIGTDYYLARRLVANGHRIRYVHDSVVATHYHRAVPSYMRQQTRWLRNIVIHGWRTSAYHEIAGALRNCGVGIVALTLPLLAPMVGPLALALWLAGLAFAGIARVRYLAFLHACGQPVRYLAYITAPLYAALDLAVLAAAGCDIVLRRRNRW